MPLIQSSQVRTARASQLEIVMRSVPQKFVLVLIVDFSQPLYMRIVEEWFYLCV